MHFLLLNEFHEIACQMYSYLDISISVYVTENWVIKPDVNSSNFT